MADAEAPRLGIGGVRHLIHADRARSRAIDRERVEAEMPTPIRRRHWIAGAFGLRQCGEQLRRDIRRGIAAEKRRIALPGLFRRLDQPAAQRREQLARLRVNLIGEIDRRPERQQQNRDDRQPRLPARAAPGGLQRAGLAAKRAAKPRRRAPRPCFVAAADFQRALEPCADFSTRQRRAGRRGVARALGSG